MTLTIWLLYVTAVLVLTVTPGPSVLMSMTVGLQHGTRGALFSALGSITAVVGIMACSAAGLGAVLAASELLFQVVKWLGVAYLFYVGIGLLRSPTAEFKLPADARAAPAPTRLRRTLYVRGLLVGASNPKALLFFTAFFPQFLNPALPQLPQFLVLGLTFVAFELFWLMFYATFAARLAPWLSRGRGALMFNRVSGGLFVTAAVALALAQRAQKQA